MQFVLAGVMWISFGISLRAVLRATCSTGGAGGGGGYGAVSRSLNAQRETSLYTSMGDTPVIKKKTSKDPGTGAWRVCNIFIRIKKSFITVNIS